MRPMKLTKDQRAMLAERHRTYVRLRIEAAKHSPHQLARELGVHVSTVENYLNRPAQ